MPMELTFVRPYKSIEGSVTNGTVANFMIVSGRNGAGKSNLLEAIHMGALSVDSVPTVGLQQPQQGIRLFGLAQLVAAAEGAQPVGVYRDRWVQFRSQVNELITHRRRFDPQDDRGVEEAVRQQLVAQRLLSPGALNKIVKDAGKRLIDFDDDDFRLHAPLFHGARDPFTLTVGEVFLTYHARRNRNDYSQWLRDQGKESGVALSDDEFVSRYGPPPWELLDELAHTVGLEYRFDPPRGPEEDLQYEPALVHLRTGRRVTLGQLSAGEKTLMAIVMSLYGGTRLGDAIELPRVLLLDEPDASLHPSMVSSLLRVVDEMFHRRLGVKVILTTHAPSTVALAPEEALYVMRDEGAPRLVKVNRDDALRDLTVGIPTLSVRNEHRRQVFVESEYDEECYQELFRHLRRMVESPFTLEFIASGKGGNGNAHAVQHLVRSLQAAGNVAIQGIVDRDARRGAGDGIRFAPERYALENLILDPLPLGAFLLYERLVTPSDLGLPEGMRHFDLSAEHSQAVVDAVCERVGPEDGDSPRRSVRYAGSFSAEVPEWWLDTQGHALEESITTAIPGLKRFRDRLKLRVAQTVYADVPTLAPRAMLELFGQLLGAPT